MNDENELMEVITKNLNWQKDNLTENEKILLTTHTTNTNVWNNPDNMQIAQNIFSRIEKTPHDIILYSGAEIPIDQFTFGSPLNLKYFTSSYNRHVAEKYAKMLTKDKACLFILTIPTGSQIICLDNLSVHGNSEHEVLLNCDFILNVTHINHHDNYLIVHAICNK